MWLVSQCSYLKNVLEFCEMWRYVLRESGQGPAGEQIPAWVLLMNESFTDGSSCSPCMVQSPQLLMDTLILIYFSCSEANLHLNLLDVKCVNIVSGYFHLPSHGAEVWSINKLVNTRRTCSWLFPLGCESCQHRVSVHQLVLCPFMYKFQESKMLPVQREVGLIDCHTWGYASDCLCGFIIALFVNRFDWHLPLQQAAAYHCSSYRPG